MNEEKKPFFDPSGLDLQMVLSLGYLYLMVIGLLDDIIFFRFLGVNIFYYVSLSDIIMAPLNTIFGTPFITITVFVLMILGSLYITKFFPFLHAKGRTKIWYQKMVKDMDKTDETVAKMKNPRGLWTFLPVFFAFLVLGLRVGSGSATSERIEQGNFSVTHSLTFNNGKTKKVKIVAQNSTYIFFAVEGEKVLTIVPISGNIVEIKNVGK
jgi:hypothetical protein